jgi:hypothetical protein
MHGREIDRAAIDHTYVGVGGLGRLPEEQRWRKKRNANEAFHRDFLSPASLTHSSAKCKWPNPPLSALDRLARACDR